MTTSNPRIKPEDSTGEPTHHWHRIKLRTLVNRLDRGDWIWGHTTVDGRKRLTLTSPSGREYIVRQDTKGFRIKRNEQEEKDRSRSSDN